MRRSLSYSTAGNVFVCAPPFGFGLCIWHLHGRRVQPFHGRMLSSPRCCEGGWVRWRRCHTAILIPCKLYTTYKETTACYHCQRYVLAFWYEQVQFGSRVCSFSFARTDVPCMNSRKSIHSRWSATFCAQRPTPHTIAPPTFRHSFNSILSVLTKCVWWWCPSGRRWGFQLTVHTFMI